MQFACSLRVPQPWSLAMILSMNLRPVVGLRAVRVRAERACTCSACAYVQCVVEKCHAGVGHGGPANGEAVEAGGLAVEKRAEVVSSGDVRGQVVVEWSKSCPGR